jgi:hypothetical protein
MLLKLLYWTAVLAISLALVIGLILFFESRDRSSLDSGGKSPLDPASQPAFTRAV